jgi:hypothetical protein
MRVGVLTFHRCVNYGSYWQSRALLDGLRARGHDVLLLDHDSRDVRRAERRCALRPAGREGALDVLRYGVKALRFSRAIAKLPRSRRFDLDDPRDVERFDAVVVGSDEVWNFDHPWYGGRRLFFGDGLRAERVVAYAASFGGYAGARLEEGWARRLRAFRELSVRDEPSLRLVAGALGRRPELVLDPCLQFAPRADGIWRGPEERFVAVYGHGFSEQFARDVSRRARARGLATLSVGYRNDWADLQWMTAGPLDFALVMRRAEAVVTNFFHGCVFAVLHGRPLACETMPYRSAKVLDFLSRLNALGRLSAAALDEPLAEDVALRVAELRESSTAYLDRALA